MRNLVIDPIKTIKLTKLTVKSAPTNIGSALLANNIPPAVVAGNDVAAPNTLPRP